MSISVQRVEINGYSISDFKPHPDMSEETLAFSATLHHDGKEVGKISNNGRGGASLVRSSDPVHRGAVPDVETEYVGEFFGTTFNMSVDNVLVALAELAQSIASKRGSVDVIPNPDIQRLISSDGFDVLTVRSKGGKQDPVQAAERVMDQMGLTSAAVSIDGVLHIVHR